MYNTVAPAVSHLKLAVNSFNCSSDTPMVFLCVIEINSDYFVCNILL